MRKFYLLFIGLIIINILNAQIGINTENPQTLFHVDPKGDTNGITGTSDDVVITNTGNVGIGTITPNYKLEIISSTPAIRIADGTEGAGKTLTSDANGVASWQKGTQMIRILGDNPIGISITKYSKPEYQERKIILTTGIWVVRYNITWAITYLTASPSTVASYIDVFLSKSPNAQTAIQGSWTITPIVQSHYASSQISIIYEVTEPSESLYLWAFYNGNLLNEVKSYDPISSVQGNIFEAIRW